MSLEVKQEVPKDYKKANYDTIKLQPKTIQRLRNCYYNDHNNRPDTLTFDELVNNLLDKIESLAKAK